MTGYVYMMTNKNNAVLYTGVTNNLERRIFEHQNKNGGRFTSKYNVNKLVWFQEYHNIVDAIGAEKQIKAGSRKKKNVLVNDINPSWSNLMEGEV